MKQTLANFFDNFITFLLLIVAGLTPLIFATQTTEFFEMPKMIFLVFATILLLGLWIFSWILKGKVMITRTPLDIPLIGLLVVVIISTYLSSTKFPAIYGVFPRVHGSAVSWITYIILYFITASHLKSINQIKSLLYVLYASAIVVCFITLMSFFKVFLPLDFAKAVNFTPTGSSFSTVAFLLMLLPMPLLSLAKPNKYMPIPVALFVAIFFSMIIVLIGSLPTYIMLALLFVVCGFALKVHHLRKTLGMFLVPIATTALVFILAYLPLPGGANKIQSLEANFPKEIQLPFDMSWKVSASVFRDAPFFGTGPSTYLFNFTTYKPAEFNILPYWNFSFDTAYNEFLQLLGTIGAVGLGIVALLCVIVFFMSMRNMFAKDSEESPEIAHILVPGLALSGLVAIALFAIHATTVVSLVITFFMFAALVMSQKSIREKVSEFSIGLKASTHDNKQFDLFPILLFVLFVVGAVPVVYKAITATRADYYHRLALTQASKNGTQTYQYLQKAESLNPEVDLYRVDMAQTNFALANALAIQKGPSKDKPQGSLTDQDKKTIQTLLSQAVTEGRVAVTLSPRSARNWEVLGSVYRNITGVAQNALTFALDAYGRAIQRDPLNPALRVSVGGIYYSAKSYDLAIRFFSDAANLKPDYANAYFNLSVALKDKGDLANATAVAQQLVTLLKDNPKSADYKAASQYYEDLKNKLAAAQAQTAPAGQTNSALQQNAVSGVNVNNLNNPPQVTPAPAVKQNPNANLPQGIITPTPAK